MANIKIFKHPKFILTCAITLAVLVSVVGVSLGIRDTNNGTTTVVLTIGNPAYAAGTLDYVCDGVDDNVQFQAAMDALPATGGRLVVLTGTYSFSATVTRAIANITIEGTGRGTYISYDGVNPVFTAGGNGWHFTNLRTDVGGINMGATDGGLWTNVTIGNQLYTYYAPTAGIGSVFDLTAENSLTIGVLTSGRVPYASVGGLLVDSANLTFSTDTLASGSADTLKLGSTAAEVRDIYLGSAGKLYFGTSQQGALKAGTSWVISEDGFEVEGATSAEYRWTDTGEVAPAGMYRAVADTDVLFFERATAADWSVQEEFLKFVGSSHNGSEGKANTLVIGKEVGGSRDQNFVIHPNEKVTDATERSWVLQSLDATGDAFVNVITVTPNSTAPTISLNNRAVSGLVLGGPIDFAGEQLNRVGTTLGSGYNDFGIYGNYQVTDATERAIKFSVLNATADTWITVLTLQPNVANPYVQFDVTPKFSENVTSTKTSSLGANNPATDNTTPYTWLKVLSGDGSTVYIPAWK